MTAIELNKPIQLMHESDPRHGERVLHEVVALLFALLLVPHRLTERKACLASFAPHPPLHDC